DAEDAGGGVLPEHLALEGEGIDSGEVGQVLGGRGADEALALQGLGDARAVPAVAVGEVPDRPADALLQDALALRDFAARLVERLVGENGVLRRVGSGLDSVRA